MVKDPTSEFADDAATELSHAAGGSAGAAALDTSFFGHPRGLSTLFFTEMWERFSYYGMRALLILFMTASVADGGLGFAVPKAAAIVGLYAGFVYLMTLPGGWVADRLIGTRWAVLIGGMIIASGHFCMAYPSLPTFYLGLVLIVLGTGLLKPNVSTMVGQLYPEKGARRDAGFSIFYMGINLGAWIAPFVTGFLGEKINWHLGFMAAGIGMVLGLVQYVVGWKHLGTAGRFEGSAEARERARHQFTGAIAVLALLVIAFFLLRGAGVLHVTAVDFADASGLVILAATVLFFVYAAVFGGLDATEKKRLAAIFVFFLAAAVFWSGFEQAASSLNLVAERITNRVMFGWTMPASYFQSIDPLFIILLAPVFAWLWVRLGRREPSSPVKFAFGLFFLAVGFAFLVAGTSLANGGHKISPMWLVTTYFFFTIGELSLSPVGLSVMTKLAPEKIAAQIMGIWFMADSVGNLIAGRAAGFFTSLPLPRLFGTFALVAVIGAVLMLIFARPVRKLMSGIH